MGSETQKMKTKDQGVVDAIYFLFIGTPGPLGVTGRAALKP